MSLRLIIEDDEGTTTIVPLGKDAITIGRQQGNTIQLTEKNVSRRHARLYLDDGDAWVIEDLGSYNGVKVNGAAIEGRITLKEGDVVQIGDYHLALTEDVDKRTLNFSGAANDPGTGAAAAGAEPMLASSSTELPRLSPDEMAMLQSGPQAVSNPMLDSGAIPASAGGYEERRKGGSGFLVGFGAVVVIALIIGVVWLASSGGSSEEADTAKVASAGETKTAPAKGVAPTPTTEKPDTPAAPADPSDSAGEEEPIDVVDDPPVPPVDDPPVPAESGDADVVIGDDDPPTPTPPTPPPSNNNKPKNRRTPKRNPQSNSPKPTAPKEPAVDADALVAEARGVAFSNPKRCFELAKKSYQAKRSGSVAQLMASCACRMGDAGKAKYAIGKVGPSKRDGFVKMCEAKGVKL